jgi:hypothetical protein
LPRARYSPFILTLVSQAAPALRTYARLPPPSARLVYLTAERYAHAKATEERRRKSRRRRKGSRRKGRRRGRRRMGEGEDGDVT